MTCWLKGLSKNRTHLRLGMYGFINVVVQFQLTLHVWTLYGQKPNLTIYVLTLYLWKRPISRCCQAWLLTINIKIYVKARRQVCLLATMMTRQKHGAWLGKCEQSGRSILQRQSEVCWCTFTVVNLIANVSYVRVDQPSALCCLGVFRCSIFHLGICSGFSSTMQKPSSGGPMCQTGANMQPLLLPGYCTRNRSQQNENLAQNESQKSGQKCA